VSGDTNQTAPQRGDALSFFTAIAAYYQALPDNINRWSKFGYCCFIVP